ncbi:hypothetical protein Apa02nite_082310 [Actinoplanes palleronii]|uniref:Uncharacterized protein n=1 Tax=Actinoplanes palleronii TaxID=113570 RepID=A0ABQ4BN94_9ACTN|nr:hypothetical protein Apa02nite_082310 [Actinoplanes palleronii]
MAAGICPRHWRGPAKEITSARRHGPYHRSVLERCAGCHSFRVIIRTQLTIVKSDRLHLFFTSFKKRVKRLRVKQSNCINWRRARNAGLPAFRAWARAAQM